MTNTSTSLSLTVPLPTTDSIDRCLSERLREPSVHCRCRHLCRAAVPTSGDDST